MQISGVEDEMDGLEVFFTSKELCRSSAGLQYSMFNLTLCRYHNDLRTKKSLDGSTPPQVNFFLQSLHKIYMNGKSEGERSVEVLENMEKCSISHFKFKVHTRLVGFGKVAVAKLLTFIVKTGQERGQEKSRANYPW
jgi:hypothetical protein